MEKAPNFNFKLAICVALFSFANYVTQPLYSAFVPVLMNEYLSSATGVGVVLSGCNFLAMLIHPMIGSLSDQTRCRYGRRRPYILVGAISCGLCFSLIPWLTNFWEFTGVLALYSLTVAFWRTPISAIQIDCIPPEHITRSNAIASCLLALSSVFAYLGSNRLTASGAHLKWVFAAGGCSVIVMAVIGCVSVHEQDSRYMQFPAKAKGSGFAAAFFALSPKKRIRLAVMLAVVTLCYMANTSFEYFFVLFSMERLGISAGGATLYLAVYMLSYFAAAFIYSCLRRTVSAQIMTMGAVGLAALTQLGFFALATAGVGVSPGLWVLSVIYGVCWGTFNIYMYPLWLQFNQEGCSGNLMGLYFVCTGLAGVLAPILYGRVRDWSGNYNSLFAFCGVLFALSALLLLLNGQKTPGEHLKKTSSPQENASE